MIKHWFLVFFFRMAALMQFSKVRLKPLRFLKTVFYCVLVNILSRFVTDWCLLNKTKQKGSCSLFLFNTVWLWSLTSITVLTVCFHGEDMCIFLSCHVWDLIQLYLGNVFLNKAFYVLAQAHEGTEMPEAFTIVLNLNLVRTTLQAQEYVY